MKYRMLQDKDEHKKGEIVDLKQDFWSKYYTIKGIIQPYEELEIQATPDRKRKKRAKK